MMANLVKTIPHTPTGYYFIFDRPDTMPCRIYFPSDNAVTVTNSGIKTNWNEIIPVLKEWILIVRREYLEPDLWELSKSDKRLVAKEINDLENTPFTLEEQQRISKAISEIRAHLLTGFSHTETQLKFIEARLQHLEDASKRLGRKDWITLAMGTFTNIVVGVTLAPDAASELLRTAGSLLGWVIGIVQLIP